MLCPQSLTFLRHAMNPGEEDRGMADKFCQHHFSDRLRRLCLRYRVLFCWRGRGKCWPRSSVLTRPTNLSRWADRTCQHLEQSGVTSGKGFGNPASAVGSQSLLWATFRREYTRSREKQTGCFLLYRHTQKYDVNENPVHVRFDTRCRMPTNGVHRDPVIPFASFLIADTKVDTKHAPVIVNRGSHATSRTSQRTTAGTAPE
jgi:hypothetical protein